MALKRSDIIALAMILVIAALGIALLIALIATGQTEPPFHPMQLRTV